MYRELKPNKWAKMTLKCSPEVHCLILLMKQSQGVNGAEVGATADLWGEMFAKFDD